LIFKNNVLILGKDLSEPGGINNYFNLFLRHFSHNNIKIHYFTFGLKDSIQSKRVTKYLLKYINDLHKFTCYLMKNKNINIIHINTSFVFIPFLRDSILLIISKFLKRKIVVFIHGWKLYFYRFLTKFYMFRFFLIKVYSLADRILVLAEDFKKILINWGIKEEKIHVTKMMFDGSLFFNNKNSYNNKIIRFLYLGRLQDNKGIFDILRALYFLREKRYNFYFTFVGNPVNDKILLELNNRIRNYKLNKFVSIKGYLIGKDKIREFEKADVFVFPSYTEGCPNAVLEAMAAGLFIISSDAGALKEIIINGKNGFIVQKRNAKDLADKMEESIVKRNLIEIIGQNNRFEAFRKYELNIIISQIKEIYNGLID